MTNFARSLAELAGSASRRIRIASLALVLTSLIIGACAQTAGAQVVSIGAVPVGLQGRVGAEGEAEPETYSQPPGQPGPPQRDHLRGVLGPDRPLPRRLAEPHRPLPRRRRRLERRSGLPVRRPDPVHGQDERARRYVNAFHGSYTDTTAYPANGCVDPEPLELVDRIGPGKTTVCLTSSQVAAQLEAFVAAHNLPKGMGSDLLPADAAGRRPYASTPAAQAGTARHALKTAEESTKTASAATTPRSTPAGSRRAMATRSSTA